MSAIIFILENIKILNIESHFIIYYKIINFDESLISNFFLNKHLKSILVIKR